MVWWHGTKDAIKIFEVNDQLFKDDGRTDPLDFELFRIIQRSWMVWITEEISLCITTLTLNCRKNFINNVKQCLTVGLF